VHDLRAAQRARGTFLSLLAHEQRTPLTALVNYVAIMRRRGVAPVETLDRMEAQCDRMARLVDKLADSARLEAGRALELDLGTVDLVAVVERVVAALGLRLPVDAERGHRVEVRAASRPLPVVGDAERIADAVRHVVENAVKFSPRGGAVVVDVAAGASGPCITVTDPGIGIPADELAHLGRPYFRGRNAPPEEYPGIGLGLAMTREIVERHGGRLEVTSEPGRGTAVSLVLPEVPDS
jgi:two-component system, OmpR family, sensor histidine kinase VicK